MARNINIDIGLSVLCALQQPGQTLTYMEIADVCGCNKNYIDELEKTALRKLRNRTAKNDFFKLPELENRHAG